MLMYLPHVNIFSYIHNENIFSTCLEISLSTMEEMRRPAKHNSAPLLLSSIIVFYPPNFYDWFIQTKALQNQLKSAFPESSLLTINYSLNLELEDSLFFVNLYPNNLSEYSERCLDKLESFHILTFQYLNANKTWSLQKPTQLSYSSPYLHNRQWKTEARQQKQKTYLY